MYYLSIETITNAFALLKDKTSNKFWGLLSILNNIKAINIGSNETYEISSASVSFLLDKMFYLEDVDAQYEESSLYVKFSKEWQSYVAEKFITEQINIYAAAVFAYKFEAFENQLTKDELACKFLAEFNIQGDVIQKWFNKVSFEIEYSCVKTSKTQYKKSLGVKNDTISLESPYSIVARAGALTRAPFLQTLYAGMDSIKCLLILKEDIEQYYSSKIESLPSVEKEDDNHLSLALRAFKSARHGKEWQERKDGYQEINVRTREYYGKNEEIMVANFEDFCLKHTWTGKNGGGCWAHLSKSDWQVCCSIFNALRTETKFTLSYLERVDEYPSGVGMKLVSEILMKFHPDKYCYYNEVTHNVLKILGLIEDDFNHHYTAQDYAAVYGVFKTIRNEMRKLNIEKTCEEKSGDADYLTVNEFIYFVSTHEQFIKEEMMKMTLEDIEVHPYDGQKKFNFSDEPLMLRLMSALRTKPFAILAGHSGTGKSRMVRRLAYMTCCDEGLRGENDPGNFLMVQVKPNWHDSTDLLGYYSALEKKYKPTDFVRFICKAYAYPDVPFFVCLDEMNLAPVEQYFAEYLSAIESMKYDGNEKKYLTDKLISQKGNYELPSDLGAESKQAADWIEKNGLTIPKNLFVVGTVNMDETTCQFSRKVLDRAMTIEMNEIKFEDFGKTNPPPSYDDTVSAEEARGLIEGDVQVKELEVKQAENLKRLKKALDGTAFVVAYRFANEYALYEKSLKHFGVKDTTSAFDEMVLMKVLPRIIGDRSLVEGIFKNLKDVLGEVAESSKRMDEIKSRKGSYLSFWP